MYLLRHHGADAVTTYLEYHAVDRLGQYVVHHPHAYRCVDPRRSLQDVGNGPTNCADLNNKLSDCGPDA